ncbi:MAG: phospholipase D-like domain-containing protein, partial [Burkholderiaceae bacterium]
AFCGGINVLDDLFDPNHGNLTEPRLDFAVRVCGPLVRDVLEAMTHFWWRHQHSHEVDANEFPAAWRGQQLSLRRAARAMLARGWRANAVAGDLQDMPGTARAGLLLRDNLRNRRKIEAAYLQAISAARSEIFVANAYFLPGARLRRALTRAARRGVKVRLLLQGRYEYFLQYHASRPVYGALLEAGVEIYEYAASFLHAKVAVVDSVWATVGSSNLDPLSLLMSREANVMVLDEAFAVALKATLERAISRGGKQLDARLFGERPWLQQVKERLAYSIMRFGLLLIGRRY